MVNSRLAVTDRHLQEDEAGDDDVQWMTDTSAAAAEKRAQEQLTAAMAGMVTQGNIEAEQEAARKREEKRKAEEEVARQVSECSLKAVSIAPGCCPEQANASLSMHALGVRLCCIYFLAPNDAARAAESST